MGEYTRDLLWASSVSLTSVEPITYTLSLFNSSRPGLFFVSYFRKLPGFQSLPDSLSALPRFWQYYLSGIVPQMLAEPKSPRKELDSTPASPYPPV